MQTHTVDDYNCSGDTYHHALIPAVLLETFAGLSAVGLGFSFVL